MSFADLLGRLESLVGLGWRHPDVDDRHVRLVRAHLEHQVICRAALADYLEAGVLKQSGDPLAEQHRGVGKTTRVGAQGGTGRR